MDSAVYIGAGIDIMPAIMLLNIKKFIYIDSLPNTEYGTFGFGEMSFFHDDFMEKISKVMNNNGFILGRQEKDYLEYVSDDRIIKYYVNTAFPEMLDSKLISEISKCNTLIIAGYNPDKLVIDLMPKLKYIIGKESSAYVTSDDTYDKDKVCDYLYDNYEKYNDCFLIKGNCECWDPDKIYPGVERELEVVKVNILDFFNLYKN